VYEPERVSVCTIETPQVLTATVKSDRLLGAQRRANPSFVAARELRLFKVPHLDVVEHYEARRCSEEPDEVVQEFLQILSQK
jgi:hypothetical protein